MILLLACTDGTDTKPSADDTGVDGESGVPEACSDDGTFFEATAWDGALRDTCVRCHMAGSAAAATGFVLVPTATEGWRATNEAATAAMARRDVDGGPYLLAKAGGLVAHGGGVQAAEGSAAWEALSAYVAWARGESCEPAAPTCTGDEPGPRQLRRLTHAEYGRSVRDLLHVTSQPEDGFAADDVVGAFANSVEALDVDSLLADQYRLAAESLAAEADLAALLPCDPADTGYAACATLFIEDFGLRAFRRPLTADDVHRYYALWASVAREEGFEAGLRWTIAAMLQSPHFLYRMELGEGKAGSYRLTGWEVATELSYLYLGTTPDDELLAAAASGDLDTDTGRAAQAARLAADPRAAETVARFVAEWLQLERLANVSRDAGTYPAFTTDIRTAMAGETERFLAGLADATVADLFRADHTWVTDELAAYYGIEPGTEAADAEGYRYVPLDGVRYGGLLTQGSVLATWALPSSSSPVHRGVLVRERLLCQDLPPPPANLDTSPPPVDPSLSTRERYAAHAALPECAICHDLIDPIGFGFEHYDGVGRYREDDGGHVVDATGEIVGSPTTTGPFDGVFALQDVLATAPEVQTCFSVLWVTWATGLVEEEALTCAAADLAESAAPGDLGLSEPLQRTVELAHFATRTGEGGDTPARGVRIEPELPADTGTWGPVEDPVVLTLTIDSDWTSGYCASGHVVNNSEDTVTWSVRSPQDGTISSIWNASWTADGADWVFVGVDWNGTIAPGGTADFGFCATR